MADAKESPSPRPPIQEQPQASNIPPSIWNLPWSKHLASNCSVHLFTTIEMVSGLRRTPGISTYNLICDENVILKAFSDKRDAKLCDSNHPPIFLEDLSGISIMRLDVGYAKFCSSHNEIVVSAPPEEHLGSIQINKKCCSSFRQDDLEFKLENGDEIAKIKPYADGALLEIYGPMEPVMKAIAISFLICIGISIQSVQAAVQVQSQLQAQATGQVQLQAQILARQSH